MKNESVNEVSFAELKAVVMRRSEEFLGVAAIVISVSLLASFIMPAVYRGQSKMLIQNDSGLYPQGIIPQIQNEKGYLASQLEVISSRPVIEGALKRLQDSDMLKGQDYYSLRKKINFSYLNDSHVLQVSVYLNNPREAAELANALVNSYMGYSSSGKLSEIDESFRVVSGKAASVKSELESINSRLKALGGKEKLDFYKAQVPMFVTYLTELAKDSLDGKKDAQRFQSELARTADTVAKDDKSAYYPFSPNASGGYNADSPTASLTTIPWIQDMRSRINEAQAKLSRMSVEYADTNPEVMGIREQIAILKSSLEQELEGIMAVYTDYYKQYLGALDYSRDANEIEKISYEDRLQRVSEQIEQSAAKQIEYTTLTKMQDAVQNIYSVLLQRQNELALARERFASLLPPNVQVLEAASLPLKKVSPSVPLNLFLGVFFGLFLGMCAVFASDRKERALERRGMPRLHGLYAVTYELKSGKFSEKQVSLIENISGSGVALRTKERLDPGQEVLLVIHLEDDIVHSSAEVVDVCNSAVQNMYTVGLKFTKINLQEQEKLLKYIYGKQMHYAGK